MPENSIMSGLVSNSGTTCVSILYFRHPGYPDFG